MRPSLFRTPRRFFPAFLIAVLLTLSVGACGDKFNVDTLGVTRPPDSYGDTSYVLQQPIWGGFSSPSDITVGHEPFLYVAETNANRIAMLDLSGARIGVSRPIPRPIAIAQDYRFNLLICAELDTVINGQAATFGAVYKVDLVAASHDIASAPVTLVYFEPSAPQRRFTGVAVLADNSYYVTRTGPNNASIVDPDDAVMLFSKTGQVASKVQWPVLAVDGTGLTTITSPTGICTLPRKSSDFIFTQKGNKSLFRMQWITQRTTGDVTQWESWYTPSRDGAVDFLRVNLFSEPEGVTADGAGNVYVVDAAKDSVFTFNASGFLTQAFGGPNQFRHPRGLAYFDKTLYIADTGNNRILRFKLSTDL